MRDFIFLWSDRNEEHIGKHNVEPVEAEHLVKHSAGRYPQKIGEEKWIVRGQAKSGRFLQAIFVVVYAEDVYPDEFERLDLYERVAINAGEPAVRIIHARELNRNEQSQVRREK